MNIEKRRLNAIIDAVAQDILPKKEFELYSIDNTVLFEIRGPSGGVTSSFIYYIVTSLEKGKPYYRYGVKLPYLFECNYTNVANSLRENYNKFVKALEDNKGKEFDPNAGDLGLGDN